jgi:hypothetical protein
MTAMDFRLYDNVLGRFFGMDALSEKNHYLSPYQFGDGNPIVFADPTGLDSEWGNHRRGDGIGFYDGGMHYSDRGFSFMSNGNGGGGGTPVFNNALDLANYLFSITPAGKNRKYGNMGNGQFAQYVWVRFEYNPNEPGKTDGLRGGTLDAVGFGFRKDFVGSPVALLIGGNGGGASSDNTNWWNNSNNVANGLNISMGFQSEILGYAICANYKSARNPWAFYKLLERKQIWRTNNTLLPAGKKLLIGTKALGAVGGVMTVGLTSYQVYEQGYATKRNVADIVINTAGVVAAVFFATTPIGWAVAGGALLYSVGTTIYDHYNP